MTFEEKLAYCIEAIEHGKSVESCLASHPEHADRLEPLLRIVGHLHEQQKLRVSHRAFAVAGEAVVYASANTQPQRAPNALPLGSARGNGPRAPQMPRQAQKRMPGLHVFGQLSWRGSALVAAAACFALVVVMGAYSLPGDALYPLKRGGEVVEGAFFQAFGEPLTWHVSQVETRVEELTRMESDGRAPDPTLVAEVIVVVEEALAEAEGLPPTVRDPILAAWLQRIQARQADTDANSQVAAVLAEPFATVESVLANQPAVVALVTAAPTTATTPAQIAAVVFPTNEEPQFPTASSTRPTVVATPRAVDFPQATATQTAAITPVRRATATATQRSATMTTASPTPPALESSAVTADGLGAVAPSDIARITPRVTSPSMLSVNALTTTPTPTRQSIVTRSPTNGLSLLPTVTNTPRLAPTATPTIVPTASPTPIMTDVPLPTVTPTRTSTNTSLPTAPATAVPTPTPESVRTATPTLGPTATQTPELVATANVHAGTDCDVHARSNRDVHARSNRDVHARSNRDVHARANCDKYPAANRDRDDAADCNEYARANRNDVADCNGYARANRNRDDAADCNEYARANRNRDDAADCNGYPAANRDRDDAADCNGYPAANRDRDAYARADRDVDRGADWNTNAWAD